MTTTNSTFTPPYPPSWVDRLIDWIDRLRMPNWLFYLGLTLLQFALYFAINLLTGVSNSDPLVVTYSYTVLYSISSLVFMHYMRGIAKRALDSFAPALAVDEMEFSRLKYQLTVMPARGALIATVLGVVLPFGDALAPASQASAVQYPISVYFFGVLGLAFTGVFMVFIVRQLLMVNRIHRTAQRINLFQFSPLYSFSSITVRIGLISIVAAYINLAIDPNVFASPGSLLFNGVLLLLGAAAFVLPLNSMHQRISTEKKRLLAEHDQRFESIVNELNEHIDSRNLTQVDALTRTLSSLVTQRDILNNWTMAKI